MLNSDFTNAERMAERERRQEERDKIAPSCLKCVQMDEKGKITNSEEAKTEYVNRCSSYVCIKCRTHYHLVNGKTSEIRFCWCGWNKQNFSPLDAGECFEEDDY